MGTNVCTESSAHLPTFIRQTKPKDGGQPADMSHSTVLEGKAAYAVKTPCEEVCQGLRHSKDEQGCRPLFTLPSAGFSLDMDAVVGGKDGWAIPVTKAVTRPRCDSEG